MSKTPLLKDFRRVVVKVGSSLLVDSSAGGLKRDWLASLAADIAGLHRLGQRREHAGCRDGDGGCDAHVRQPGSRTTGERLLDGGSSGALRARRQLRLERSRDDQSQSGRHRQLPGLNRGHAAECSSGAGFSRSSGNRSVRSRWRPAHVPSQRVARRNEAEVLSFGQ